MTSPRHKSALNRIVWRSRLKSLLRIGGILLMLLGGMFVPSCDRDLGPKATIFNRIVISGTLVDLATILIGVGIIAFAASWLVRGELYEGP